MGAVAGREVAQDAREALGIAPWWWYLVGGTLWIVYGFIVLSFDVRTVWAIALFAGFLFAVAAITEFIYAAVTPYAWWAHLILGIVLGAGAVACFVWPEATFNVLAAITGWVLMFLGIFHVAVAVTNRHGDGFWIWLLLGIAQILIAFWAVSYRGNSMILLAVWVAAVAIGKGILDLIIAYEVHHAGKLIAEAVDA